MATSSEKSKFAKKYGLNLSQLERLGEWVGDDFRIDYYDPETREKTGMYRRRRANRDGHGKYTQPAGTIPEAYFCPLVDWTTVLKETATLLLITEGEFNAAKACAEGVPCIGLGGVFNFASRKRGLGWIPTLDRVIWENRKSYIAFDSDAATKKMVRLARTRLALLLIERKAEVYVLQLPPQADGTRAGLDDYLIEHGAESLGNLVHEVKPWNKDLPLYELNTEVAYCHSPNSVVRLRDFFVMNTKDFRNDHYADRTHLIGKPGSEKCASTPKTWMEWPERLKVDGITFAPGAELITSENQLNVWRGWGGTPEKGNIDEWNELVELVLCGAKPEHVQWFRKWAAYRFQYSLARINSAILIWGPQGTGKTMLGEYLAALHGEHAHTLSQASLAGNFNSWMKSATFILGDEVTTRESKRSLAEEMKNWITRDSVRINEKYIREYELPNYAQFYLTSNHHNALALEKGDRRYFVHEVTAPPADAKTFARLGQWKNEQKNINALLYHFMEEVDLAGFNPMAQPPLTEDKEEVIRANMSDMDAWAEQLALNADDPDHEELKHLYTAAELLSLAQTDSGRHYWNPTAMGWALKRAGFTDKKVIKVPGHGTQQLYMVRERDRLRKMSNPRLAELWLKERAGRPAKFEALRRPYVVEGGRSGRKKLNP
jgi:hypothetical protein